MDAREERGQRVVREEEGGRIIGKGSPQAAMEGGSMGGGRVVEEDSMKTKVEKESRIVKKEFAISMVGGRVRV